MSRQTFLTIAAGVSVLTGLAALLLPAQLAALFGVTLDDVGQSQTRLLGGAYLGYAAIVWFGRDARDEVAQRAIGLGNLTSWALALVVSAYAVATGLVGAQSWALVALEVVFTAGWAYFTFIERSQAQPA